MLYCRVRFDIGIDIYVFILYVLSGMGQEIQSIFLFEAIEKAIQTYIFETSRKTLSAHMSKYTIHLVAMAITVLAAIAWLPFVLLAPSAKKLHPAARVMGAIAGVIAIYVALQRDTYLPFLGDTALPASLLQATSPVNGNVSMTLTGLPPHAKVVYWAALPRTRAADGSMTNPAEPVGPIQAYGEYTNGGVTIVRHDGTALLTFVCPQSYHINRIGFDKILPKHVHYRYELAGSSGSPGMMSRVFTQKVNCDA